MTDQRATVEFWHSFPKDGAWRRVTLAHHAGHGWLLQPTCRACWHAGDIMSPEGLAERYGLAIDTPLLLIQRRLRCTACSLPAGYLHAHNPAVPAHTGYPVRRRD